MKKQEQIINKEHLARAKANDLPISFKHAVEICRYLRYKTTHAAKKILEETMELKTPIPFKRFNRDIGHKPGIAAGRYPQKAAKEILRLIKAVETNAQFKGLNTSSLKIIKLLANKASIPMTGGRHRNATKRTNLEIEVKETKEKEKSKKVEAKKEKSKIKEKEEKKKPEVKKIKTEKPVEKKEEKSKKEKTEESPEKKKEIRKEIKEESKKNTGEQPK